MKQRFSKRMRLVSGLLTLAMVCTFLPFSAFAATGDVAINDTNFPDPAFLEYVKQYDKNNDSILSTDERNQVYILDVEKSGIKDLTGIKLFPKLSTLKCSELGLEKLDLSENKELYTLYCSKNNLIQLELSQNAELTYLDCSGNKLTQLNLNANTMLEKLICYDNQLSALDVNSLSNLTNLSCGKNFLETLDVSGLEILKSLGCYENHLTALNVKNNSYLKDLSCGGNQLTELDLSHNPNLTDLYCSDNQLSQLDLRQNKKLTTLECFQNKLELLDVSQSTKLQTIKCADNQLTSLDVTKNTALNELDCARNQLVELDTRNNVALKKLNCESNRLAGINLDDNVYLSDISVGDNVYPAEMKSDRTVDLSKFPNCFDVERTSFWYGGTRQGNILTVKEGETKVRYQYSYKDYLTEYFYLDVSGTVPPVTPPSGGDGTGTTTPPSGGGTGTTTPPSGGGAGTTTPPSGGSTGGDGGGAAIIMVAGAAAAGVVGYGVYNYVSGQKLQALLPEGVAAPENRAQTALLLWNTAGRPEPAEAPAFADVADPDTAKAAQWCVEQGLMKRRLNGKFAPGSSIPAYQVLNAYRKLAG